MLRAVAEAPAAIVLLDGVYFTEPSVTHKELLYALEAGVRVIGAASLGALRAVELESHGMEGVGRVFERFRDGELDGDDEVALLHAPAERAWEPLTVALVELREAVEELVREGRLPEAAGRELVPAVKALPFSDRTLERIQDLAAEAIAGAAGIGEGGGSWGGRGCPLPQGEGQGEGPKRNRTTQEEALAVLCRRLEAPGVKWRDALAALAASEPSGRCASLPVRTPETEFSVWFKEEHVRPHTGNGTGSTSEDAPTLLEALRAVQLLHPEAPELIRRLRLRFLLATEGERAGLEPAAGEIEEVAAGLAAACRAGDGPPPLPAPELRVEARVRLLAEAACRRHGGPGAALGALARRLGLSRGRAEEDLLALVASRRGLLADWALARGLALAGNGSPAPPEGLPAALSTPSVLPAALAAAAAAGEVHRCFLRWRGEERSARVAEPVLREVAAALWGAPAGGVEAEAVRRGLYPSTGHSPGLYEALEWIAPAERLPEAVNGYPEARVALVGVRIQGDATWLGDRFRPGAHAPG